MAVKQNSVVKRRVIKKSEDVTTMKEQGIRTSSRQK